MRADLAVERMTLDQLWKTAWKLTFDVEPYNLGAKELRERQLRWRQLRLVLGEIEDRDAQQQLQLSTEEEVSAHRHVDSGVIRRLNASPTRKNDP